MIEEYKPNFKIVCEVCGSEEVEIDSCVGFSSTSGAWGEITLICTKCKNKKDIWRPE